MIMMFSLVAKTERLLKCCCKKLMRFLYNIMNNFKLRLFKIITKKLLENRLFCVPFFIIFIMRGNLMG